MGDYRDARDNAAIILEYTNICPFKWNRNMFKCAYCKHNAVNFSRIRKHMVKHSTKSNRIQIFSNSRPAEKIKAEISNIRCELCDEKLEDVSAVMDHLIEQHNKPITKSYGSGIIPFLLEKDFICGECGEIYDQFKTLNTHMFKHLPKRPCPECGVLCLTDQLRKHIRACLRNSNADKFTPKFSVHNARPNASIILECSNVCPFKWYRNVFGCPYCDYSTPEFNLLKIHMNDHPDKSERVSIFRNMPAYYSVKVDITDLSCDLCQERVKDLSALVDHLVDKHKKPILKKYGSGIIPYLLGDGFTCAYCGDRYDRFVTLNTHVIKHNLKCECIQCGQSFSNKERLRVHLTRSHPNAQKGIQPKSQVKFKFGHYDDARHNACIILENSNVCTFKWHRNVFGCSYCPATSAEFAPIKAHDHPKRRDALRGARPSEILKADISDLKCNLCDKEMKDLNTLLEHLGAKHNKPIKKEYGSGMMPFKLSDGWACADCGLKFDRFLKLTMHMNEHRRNCICPQCGQAFSCISRLRAHCKLHKNNPKQFKCLSCGDMFNSVSKKQKHMETEHDILPHKCPYCNERFKTYGQRLEHLREYHDRKIDFPCRVCLGVFKSASNRAEHMRQIHLKVQRQYRCRVCDYSCTSNSRLKKHKMRHTVDTKQS